MLEVIEAMRKVTAKACNMDELVFLSASARIAAAEYEILGAKVPEWLEDQVRLLRAEVAVRIADEKALRIRQLRGQLDSLKTAQEKRAAIEAELAALSA